jgi:membrane protease YdiL (CAAX protease family)
METVSERPTRIPWRFFFLAFGITWLIWSPGVFSTLGLIELPVPFIVFFFVGTWGPFLAASWVTYRDAGWSGVKAFWRCGFRFNIPAVWWLVIVGMPLLVSAVPLGLHILFGGPGPEESLLSQPLMIIPVFLTYFLTGGGNEEWGWRGYALDRLQNRWNPTVASLVLGVIWGCWHIPLFFVESTGQYHMSLLAFILATPGISILHTWVYNKTGRNLLAAWVFHSLLGAAWEVFPIVQPQVEGYQRVYVYDFIAMTVVAVLVLLIEGSLLGYKNEALEAG